MPLRSLFIDMNSFFASVEQQDKPHLRGRPVAVIPTDAETTACIAASYEAKAFGVRTGTPVWQARAGSLLEYAVFEGGEFAADGGDQGGVNLRGDEALAVAALIAERGL